MLLALPCSAQTDESLLLTPWEGTTLFEGDASIFWAPDSAPADSGGRSDMVEAFSSGRVRLSTEHELNPSLGYDLSRVEVHDPLGRFPGILSDESGAFATPLGTFGEWFAAAGVGVGYAGDEQFSVGHAWYGKGTLTAGRKLGNDTDLVLWLDYDGNRTLLPDIPIPSVAYAHDGGKGLSYVLGFPSSSVTWKPIERLTFEGSYEPPVAIEARSRLDLGGGWSISAGYVNQTLAFRPRDVAAPDRLFYDEQRVDAGLRWQFRPGCSVGGTVGFAFGRRFSVGYDDRDRAEIARLPERVVLSLGVEISF